MGKLISDFVEKQLHTFKNACFDLMAVIANQVVFLKNYTKIIKIHLLQVMKILFTVYNEQTVN